MRTRFIYGISVMVLILFIVIGWGTLLTNGLQNSVGYCGQESLIRLHVLANSDSPEDQDIKLRVRDAVIKYLAPYLENVSNVEDAREITMRHQTNIQKAAEEVLRAYGCQQNVIVERGVFEFPVKAYGEIVVPAGKYEAVRVLIGNAQGKNWWCVLFPPLCFIDITNATAVVAGKREGISKDKKIEYKSKLLEVLNERKETHDK